MNEYTSTNKMVLNTIEVQHRMLPRFVGFFFLTFYFLGMDMQFLTPVGQMTRAQATGQCGSIQGLSIPGQRPHTYWSLTFLHIDKDHQQTGHLHSYTQTKTKYRLVTYILTHRQRPHTDWSLTHRQRPHTERSLTHRQRPHTDWSLTFLHIDKDRIQTGHLHSYT